MSGFRSPWNRAGGSPETERPRALVGLLALLGLLAAVVGLHAGAGVHEDASPLLHGVLVALAWMAPYLIGARVAWKGATPDWYGVIQALGLAGTLLSIVFVFLIPALDFGSGPRPAVSSGNAALYYAIFVPLLLANVAVFVLGRSEEARFYGECTRGYFAYRWSVMLAAAYFALTLAL